MMAIQIYRKEKGELIPDERGCWLEIGGRFFQANVWNGMRDGTAPGERPAAIEKRLQQVARAMQAGVSLAEIAKAERVCFRTIWLLTQAMGFKRGYGWHRKGKRGKADEQRSAERNQGVAEAAATGAGAGVLRG